VRPLIQCSSLFAFRPPRGLYLEPADGSVDPSASGW
jgi:hypothetical protein